MHCRFSLTLALLLAACAPPNRSEPQAQGGLPVWKPRILQRDLATGSTSIGLSQGVSYEMEGVMDAAAASALAAKVEASAAFFDAAGGRTASIATVVAPVRFSADDPFRLQLAPAAPLAADAWHGLRFTPSSDFVVGPFDSPRSTAADVAFFTGSAPRLRYLQRYRDKEGNSEYLVVRLSEPVSFASAATPGLALTSESGAALQGCVWWGNDCVASASTLSMSAFTFKLTTPLTAEPGISKLVLFDPLVGAGRTVGAAKGVVAAALGGTVTTNGVEYVMPEADWFACFGEPLTMCWMTPTPIQ